MPSPQKSLHYEGVFTSPPEHEYPLTNPLQVELHPAMSKEPSSHVSGEITWPSPQIGLHIEGEPLHS